MKTRGIQISLGALLLIAGAGDAVAGRGGPDSSSSMIIVPGVSVGPVRAEMTPRQVIAKIGEPDRRNGATLEYWNLGFSVIPRGNRVHTVFCVDPSGQAGAFKKAFGGHTKEGVGMKSSRADVIRAYGQPTATERLDDDSAGEILRYKKQGLYFRLRAGKVDTIGVIFEAPK